jgi:cobalt/nickel transport protein
MKMKLWVKNTILIVLVLILAIVPLWLCRDAEFGGADGQAEELIYELDESYTPIFEPIFEPASGEIESLLFALQAAIGAGVIGFCIGRLTANKKNDSGKDSKN